MKVFILLFLFSFLLFGKGDRVFFNIKSKIEIPSDFRDGVEEALTKRDKTLIDEETQEEALKQQSEQRKGDCYKDACLVDTGQMLVANNIVLLKVEKKNDKLFKFKISLINVETGNKTSTVSMYYKSKLSDYEKLNSFGKELVFKIFPLSCPEGYTTVKNKCVDHKYVSCNPIGIPKHGKALLNKVKVSYESSIWQQPALCDWVCDKNYSKEDGKCINKKKVICDTSKELKDGAVWVENNVLVRYKSNSGWSEPANCKRWVCGDGYKKKKGNCIASKSYQVNNNKGINNHEKVKSNIQELIIEGSMINIPAGKGLPAFSIDQYEVTVAQFRKCVDAGKCRSSNFQTKDDYKYYNYGNREKDNHPMNAVNWYGAKEYCEYLGKRLPTDVEWKYAAFGNDERKYPWGNDKATCVYAVMNGGCGKNGTWKVGSKPLGKTPLGVYDMAGNVREWLEDNNNKYGTRGAAGGDLTDSEEWLRKNAYRFQSPIFISYKYGFRCVKSLP